MEFLENVLRIVQVVLGLGFVIFVHELGHFLMAKKNGVRVEVFSLGFGPAIVRFRRGETEYRLSVIPLGGFVKMTGEALGEDRTGQPHELTSKSAWQRFQIFVAGAVTNLIFSVPLCIAALLVGMNQHPPEAAQPMLPEARAGMQPGDTVLEVAGVPIHSAEEYKMRMASHSSGESVLLRIRRGAEEQFLTIHQSGARNHGIYPRFTAVPEVVPGSPAAEAGLQAGDVILRVAGKPVFGPEGVTRGLTEHPGEKVEVVVRRPDPGSGEFSETSVFLSPPPRTVRRLPVDDHLIAPVVGAIHPSSYAFGKLQDGDRILRVEGIPVPCLAELTASLQGRAGQITRVTVSRNGEEVGPIELTPGYGPNGDVKLGIPIDSAMELAHVREESPYHAAGLRTGDQLIEIPGVLSSVRDLLDRRDREKPLTVFVKRGGKRMEIGLNPVEETTGDVENLGLPNRDGVLLLWPERRFRRWGMSEAFRDGFVLPLDLIQLTYVMLFKLVKAEESVTDLSGPAGIAKVSYDAAGQEAGNFLWLLALITVNLGVFNLLPIPVLDGGHVLLLLFEKIKGSPLSEQFVLRFQFVGLFFLLGLILLVTSNDVMRFVVG